MSKPGKKEGHPVLSYHPIKAIFTTGYVCSMVARLPLWAAQSSAAGLRPAHTQRWTAKQLLMSRAVYSLLDIESRIGITEKLSLEPRKEGDRWQVLHPSDASFYKGPLVSETVVPEDVGGTWYPHKPEDVTGKRVALFVHGGAFVKGDGRDEFCGFASNLLAKHGRVDYVYTLQYRLSGWQRLNPFPAGLQDALTAYLYLVHQLGASQVVVVGDSAGGNLVVALLRYIAEFGAEAKIPAPACAFLASPWVAPMDFEIESNPRFNSDLLPRSFLRWGALTYTAGHENPERHPYLTPLGNPFHTSTPIFVNAGTAEMFLEPIQQWVQQMKGVSENRIEYNEEENALHDTFLLGALAAFETSAEGVVGKLADYMDKL